ncbi:hypothetical protein [Priestia megaterium]|uniref:hypothetical protein n=1 Tax=Priestia megaterium TaxID=1404 RepID=UPI0023DC9E98|nr:hypothetical protein [Priestia megaterium]MDF2015547.1 hypothetical protein [Priestia megaterium]
MTQTLEMNNAIEEVELQEKLYPMRENWDLLKPYLNDEDVQAVLNQAMTEFCEQHPNAEKWIPGSAPWKYTTSDYWCNQIDEATQNDEKFQKEENELFEKLYGSNHDANDEDELWFEMWNTKEHYALNNKYYDIYSPKEGTIEWYQFVHGCHWINQFTAALVSKALNVEVDVMTSDKHSIAVFVKDDTIYHADILNEWASLKELYDFMGEEIDFYSVFDELE